MPTSKSLIPAERIEKSILLIRGHKVMLDSDLAKLCGVETKVFNQAVKRNISRFPEDFLFQLTKEELEILRSQIVTSNPAAKKGLRRRPHVFTEHGILMLSSVLRSEQAVRVNIQTMRTFIWMRQLLASQKGLMEKFWPWKRSMTKNLSLSFELSTSQRRKKKNPKI